MAYRITIQGEWGQTPSWWRDIVNEIRSAYKGKWEPEVTTYKVIRDGFIQYGADYIDENENNDKDEAEDIGYLIFNNDADFTAFVLRFNVSEYEKI